MWGSGAARVWLVLGVLAAACASPGPSPSPVVHDVVAEPAPPEPAQADPPTPSPEPPAPAPARAWAGRDHRSVVACSSDADCGWNDPCLPTRCVEAHPEVPIACDESGPPPGACLCFAGACTTKPDPVPAPSGTCEPRACAVDRAAGRCVPDDVTAPGQRTNFPVEQGPSCDCIDPAKGCAFAWFEPVPCKTNRDCWIDPSPRRHPVARPRSLRKRDFRPCSDGEVMPLCGEQGHCVVGPGFGC